jgi:16S rRNA A1518/A1519 N6-dimethyltransferase RsmA/KsgA/DIM1 with predicted DNA glycosylase/AP lyase activity
MKIKNTLCISAFVAKHKNEKSKTKHLGQHFLKDEFIYARTSNTLNLEGCNLLLGIGPGVGAKYLLENPSIPIEIDTESVTYLDENMPSER